jgi:hypothetical protein
MTREMTPEEFAKSYSEKFGKSMTVEQAKAHLQSERMKGAANAEKDAFAAKMKAEGKRLSMDGRGWVSEKILDAELADLDAELAALNLDYLFDGKDK